ncbi:MAG TPA: DegT/DnrJ/EryC1/StrS family aminotransferase [Acidimicrobiia bacterium]|nr:DegT/DnrJ/EryC1/StrS family aminotransferase [Acidimicrobiia bacterium]
MDKIPLIQPDLPDVSDLISDLDRAFKSGRITNFGPLVEQFESEVSEYVGGAQAVTTSSGTMGLLFVLQALDLQPGALVAVPSFTFTASAQAILYAGGRPIFVDVDDDLTMDTNDLDEVVKRNEVAAVMPVHTFGLPARTAEIEAVVSGPANRPAVVYDAAHAFGSSDGGKAVGGFGTAEVFSLSATKALVAVEGGAVTTSDPDLANRLRKMRNYGIEANYDAWYPGLNGKMSELHAAVGLFNIRRLDEILSTRRSLAARYLDLVTSQTSFVAIPEREGVQHTYKDFSVYLPEALYGKQTEVIESLGSRGIETRRYFYPPLHEQRLFRDYVDRPLPRTEELSRRVLCLPFFTTMTDRQVETVVEALRQVEKELS